MSKQNKEKFSWEAQKIFFSFSLYHNILKTKKIILFMKQDLMFLNNLSTNAVSIDIQHFPTNTKNLTTIWSYFSGKLFLVTLFTIAYRRLVSQICIYIQFILIPFLTRLSNVSQHV